MDATSLSTTRCEDAAVPRRSAAGTIGRDRIAYVVDVFYDRIRQHPCLAEPFEIVEDWPAHKAKMAHFWWVSLGGRAYSSYRYEVVPKHAAIGVKPAWVDDWLDLFETTIRESVSGEAAELWVFRARRMGDSLRLVDEYVRRKKMRSPEMATRQVAGEL